MVSMRQLMLHVVNMKRVTIYLILVLWTFALVSFIRFTNTATRSVNQTVPDIRWNEASPGTEQMLLKYNEDVSLYLREQDALPEIVPSILSRTKVPLNETPEEFIPFRYHFHKRYFNNINKGTDNMTDKTRYLIYRCDGNAFKLCGGWADRLKGAMSGYIIANLTGRVFKMEILSPPCDLQKYIVPNLVNWSLPVSFHGMMVEESNDVQKLIKTDNSVFWNNVKSIDFTSLPEMKAKYVYYKANLDYMDGFRDTKFFQTQLSWMKNLSRDQINAVVFKRLFKLSTQLETQLNNFLSMNLKPRDKLVCIHLRTGKNPSIIRDTAIRVKEQDLPQIWNFLHEISEGEHNKIFLMSDSENVITDAKRQSFRDKLFFSDGNIVHVEKNVKLSTEEKCAGTEKVFLEQFVLMHCDSLVISKSGLSRMSAYVRGSDKGLYCVLTEGKVVPCKAREIKELYKIMG